MAIWRKGYIRKDGTRVKGHWVRGRNPRQGCAFWFIGLVAIAVVARIVG
ncbi:hypothetical protein [Streptomyces aureoversilis]|uniref:Transposase n=1 Tax=Streptomyces aureoversilis TaxID=67277 RepID=A0ABW0A394_9ACTN